MIDSIINIIVGICFLLILFYTFTKRFFWKKNSNISTPILPTEAILEQQYYVCLENEVYGPFILSELKNDYPILEDTLITTDTLNGEWYDAKYFECFDDLFNAQQDFKINEFGEIVRC